MLPDLRGMIAAYSSDGSRPAPLDECSMVHAPVADWEVEHLGLCAPTDAEEFARRLGLTDVGPVVANDYLQRAGTLLVVLARLAFFHPANITVDHHGFVVVDANLRGAL